MMADEQKDLEHSKWYSTYGLLTAQRVLERFQIELTNEELIAGTQNSKSAYHQLLMIPLKNIFNGIILQQAHDYQVYAQKQFIDYLLSGETSKDENAPGGTTRQDLEETRLKLIEIGENFNKQEMDHQTLIADSQAELITLADGLMTSMNVAVKKIKRLLQSLQLNHDPNRIEECIRVLLIQFDGITDESLALTSPFWATMSKILQVNLNHAIREQLTALFFPIADPRRYLDHILSQYTEQAKDMGIVMRSYRSQFFEVILRTTELINMLPDYAVDKAKEEENRETLYFDSHIGGD